MVETKRLSYFVQIAEDGSLSKASQSLRIAQPALSRQIHILEDYIGFPLFLRTSRGMKLTKEGELLRNAVVGPLRDIELAVQNMRSFMSRIEANSSLEMDIGLGIHPGLNSILARPLAETFATDYPNVKIRLYEAPTSTQLDWLKQGTIDFALLDWPSPDSQLSDHLIATNKLVLISPASCPQQQTLTFRQLAKLPLLLPGNHHGIRKVVDDAATQTRLTLNIQYEADSLPLILDLLQQGKGYTLLPAAVAREVRRELGNHYDLTISHISNPGLEIGTYLASRRYGEIEGSLISKIDKSLQEIVIDQLGIK